MNHRMTILIAKTKPYPAYQPSGVERLGDVPGTLEGGPEKGTVIIKKGENEEKGRSRLCPWGRLAELTNSDRSGW